mgnify:CR=1 FL=1
MKIIKRKFRFQSYLMFLNYLFVCCHGVIICCCLLYCIYSASLLFIRNINGSLSSCQIISVERFGDAIDPMFCKTSALLRHFRNIQLNRIGRFKKILWLSQSTHELYESAQKYLSVKFWTILLNFKKNPTIMMNLKNSLPTLFSFMQQSYV